MPYERYRNSTNPALQILSDCHIDRLPMDIDVICEILGVCVLSYDAGAEVIERAHLYRAVRSTNGLAFYLRETPVILFNETQELPQVMFTIAHELGHIVFQHVKPCQPCPAGKGERWNASRKETAANQFAAQLLAPPCVLRDMGLYSPKEIMRLCMIPQQAAAYSARRIERLNQQRAVLTDPLELAVCARFQPYISKASMCAKEGSGRNRKSTWTLPRGSGTDSRCA